MKPTGTTTRPISTLPLPFDDNDGIAADDDEATPAAETETPLSTNQAEYIRLAAEMQRYASRNLWDGVERSYQAILALEDVSIDASTYFLAALAARNIGNTYEYYLRSQLARNVDPALASDQQATLETITEAEGNIFDVQSNYGLVDITVPDSNFSFIPSEMPFSPDQRRSIEFAQKTLAETLTFTGMLPIGISYTLASTIPNTSIEPQIFTLDAMGESDVPQPYKQVSIAATPLTERLGARASKPRLVHGEFGMSAGYRSMKPTYGSSYTLGGSEVSLFVGSYLSVPLNNHFLIRPGIRATYSSHLLRTPGEAAPDYALANQSITGSLRLNGLYKMDDIGFGIGLFSGTPAVNFTEQDTIDPIIGPDAESTVGVGSANVPLKQLSLQQSPFIGGALMFQKEFIPSMPVTVEVGVQHSTTWISGEMAEHPEWESAAPFSNNFIFADLGIGF